MKVNSGNSGEPLLVPYMGGAIKFRIVLPENVTKAMPLLSGFEMRTLDNKDKQLGLAKVVLEVERPIYRCKWHYIFTY